MIIDDFAFRSSLALVRGFVLIACAVAAADAAALLLVVYFLRFASLLNFMLSLILVCQSALAKRADRNSLHRMRDEHESRKHFLHRQKLHNNRSDPNMPNQSEWVERALYVCSIS